MEPVGAVNGQAGVNIELSSTTMRSRTQAAKEQKAAQAPCIATVGALGVDVAGKLTSFYKNIYICNVYQISVIDSSND